VFAQGDAGDKFYAVVRGRVSTVVGLPDGVQRRLAELEEGDCFGEMELIRNTPRTATARALTPCVFLTLSRTDFHRVLETSPQLRATIAALTADRDARQRSQSMKRSAP
jgi:CRP-like cAMP-binding protein